MLNEFIPIEIWLALYAVLENLQCLLQVLIRLLLLLDEIGTGKGLGGSMLLRLSTTLG
jgi:hypothetical protein